MAAKPKSEKPSVTARGRGLAAASLASIVGGVLSGTSALVQLGLLGVAVILVARILCARNVLGVRVRRMLPACVFSGQDFDMELQVRRASGGGSARSLAVYDRLLPFHERGVTVEELPLGDGVAERFRTRMVGRGRVDGIGYRVESDFPLGLFRMTKRRRGGERVLVYPRPVLPDALRAAGFDAVGDESGATSQRDDAGELHGVREFQSGDRLKHVVWPLFARSGKLVVREFDRPLPEKFSLLFHSYCPPGKLIWPEAFEHSLSLLAGLLMMCRDQSVPLDLTGPFTGWGRMEVRDPHQLSEPLEALALAKHDPSGDLVDISSALRNLPGGHPVFVVSEAPVRFWADSLPDVPRTVTCLDNTTMRIKRPALRGFRSVA